MGKSEDFTDILPLPLVGGRKSNGAFLIMFEHFDIWLAGFWEGEGCFSIQKSKYINFSLTQSGKRGQEILQTTQKYLKERGIISYLHIQKSKKYLGAKTCYHLRIRNKESAEKLLQIIGPHMKFRHDELSCAIENLMELRSARGRRWTQDEFDYLKIEYPKQRVIKIAAWLGRTPGSIISKLKELGLKRKTKWTAIEIDYLIKNYDAPLKILARQLQRSYFAVNCKRDNLRKRGLI